MAETTFRSIQLPNTDRARVPETAAEFNTGINYSIRDYCTYQGQLYRCTVAHAAGAWNSDHFTPTNIDSELDSKLRIPLESNLPPADPVVGDLWIDTSEDDFIYIIDPYPVEGSHNPVESNGMASALRSKANKINLAGDFSTSATYLVGDYTLYEGQFYKCVEKHLPGAWNYAHFRATSIAAEINSRDEVISSATSDWLDEHPDSIIGLQTDSIKTNHLTNGCVTQEKLAQNSVTEPAIKKDAVTEPKIAKGAVTYTKLSADAVRLRFENVRVEISQFVSDSTYQAYPFRAQIELTNVTSSMRPDVCFSITDAISGVFAPVADSYNGGIYIYASQAPKAKITIPVIDLVR